MSKLLYPSLKRCVKIHILKIVFHKVSNFGYIYYLDINDRKVDLKVKVHGVKKRDFRSHLPHPLQNIKDSSPITHLLY